MESREEIESMRVIDLKDFLRRHGHPMKPVARENGTPGPMRKAELLEAALEIHDDNKEGKPSPTRPSSAKASPPNPFQSGFPTPPDRRQSLQSTAREDPRVLELSAEKESPAKPRRRSAAWVDPVLLAQMRATTPTKAKDKPTRARPIAPRPSLGTPQQLPSSVFPESSPLRPPQRVMRQPPSGNARSRPAKRAPARVLTAAPKPGRSIRPMTPRRLAVRKQEPEPSSVAANQLFRSEAKRVVDVPPPLPTTRAGDEERFTVPPGGRRLALDIDDEYVSEEDPDYDADSEEAGPEDLDYTEFDDDVGYAAENIRSEAFPRYGKVEYDPAPAKGEYSKDLDLEIQEDIPIDSDHYRSDNAGESDAGSTIETEDEDQERNFADWSTSDVKTWLRDHNVKFRPRASRDVLISVARAHALHMEATASIHRHSSDQRHEKEEEDEILQIRPTAGNARRRRIISAPPPDDDSDMMEIEPAASAATSRRFAKQSNREMLVFNQKPVGSEPKRRRPAFVLLPLITLFVFLCSSGFVALSVLQKHLTMKYCDTNATSTLLDNGMECRACPRNGLCIDGVLQCDPGFVELRGRCLEDKEFNLFSERLAYSAFELVSELAGRAECGEDVPKAISPEGLASALHSMYTRRRQSFDPQRFDDAMVKAIQTLQTDDAFDVSIDENGYFSSNVPKFSIKCRLRRKLWAYKRVILVAIGVLICIVYLRVKRYVEMLHERRLDEAHASALEYLRDQVNGFRNNEEDVAFVPDIMLREEVVGRPTRENKKFWKEVEERLNRDARVMRKHQVLKGMPSYTFEYVGSRRMSGGRNSGTFFETLSRRSSFGSRTSLDSFDLGQERNDTGTRRRGFFDTVGRLFSYNTD